MLVYTNLFTISEKIPSKNKYVDMFYIWFSYIKRYAGLGPEDTLGVIIDTDTFEYLNDIHYFPHLMIDCKFKIEFSGYKRPSSLTEGCSERFNYSHFKKHAVNLYLDIDCLIIRKITVPYDGECLFVAPEGDMPHLMYGGYLLADNPIAAKMPGFSSGWFAYTDGDEAKNFCDDVLKRIVEYTEAPLYSLDQPFYNYEIFLRLTKPDNKLKICIIDSKIISTNPSFYDYDLANACFVNFCGEPGVEECHFNKMLTFICVDFSCSFHQNPTPLIDHQPKLPEWQKSRYE